VKADNLRLKAVVFVVVTAEFLGKEFLPAVAQLGIGEINQLLASFSADGKKASM
jgi:hypothetical protein